MALPSPPPYINPIPNNPFYSVPVYITKGAYYPITVGSGLNVDPITAIMTSAGGGGGGVTSVTAGSGISVSASTGAVTITNTGITSIVAGSGISVSTVGGVSTITNLKNGTVTSINTGTGLTGGPILAFGTISLANTAVTPGSYSNPTLTIDAQGRITSATSGTAIQTLTASLPLTLTAGVNPTIAINPATTLACGAVLLSDSTASTSSATAATSNALKTAYDIAIAAIPKSCITGKGALITGIGASTPVALAAGADGKVLTTCAACPEGLYWGTGGGSSVSSATPVVEGIVYGCTPSAVNSNVALGYDTQGTTGTQNVTVGWSAGKAVTGAYNVFTGYAAACLLATGAGNTTVGWGTMCNIPNGTDNIAIGGAALLGNLAGPAAICCNVAIGTNSLWNTTGCKNIAIGWGAGDLLTTGCCNVIIGNLVQAASPTGSGQLAIGYGNNRWLTGVSNGAIKPGAGIIDCAGSCGTNGQVLMSNGANAICWGTATIADATPLAAGKIVGCTVARGFGIIGLTALGVEALDTLSVAPANPNGSVAVGFKAMKLTVGPNNVAIGDCALYGPSSLGADNVAIGTFALRNAGGTDGNVAIGVNSGCNLSTGSYNVLIGAETQAPVATGSCQLVIGSGVGFCWLTGCSTKAIQPAAGIIDCTASCGTNNYVLTSQGNAIEWKPVNSVLAVPIYGSFYDTTASVSGIAGACQPVALGQTTVANGISIQNTSEIHFSVDGTYNVQFSLQFEDSNASSDIVEVWVAKNGSPLAFTNSQITLDGAGEAGLLTANIVDDFLATDYIQIYWGSLASTVTLSSLPSSVGGPVSPNAIVTVVPVGA